MGGEFGLCGCTALLRLELEKEDISRNVWFSFLLWGGYGIDMCKMIQDTCTSSIY